MIWSGCMHFAYGVGIEWKAYQASVNREGNKTGLAGEGVDCAGNPEGFELNLLVWMD